MTKRMRWTLLYKMNEMKVTKQICNTVRGKEVPRGLVQKEVFPSHKLQNHAYE